eukprot:09687.XXX_91016_91150_1 [CDS] Oithona nana genome sequencing.
MCPILPAPTFSQKNKSERIFDAFNKKWNITAILDQSESFKLLID